MKKFVVYVAVGDLPPKEALAYVDKIKDNFGKEDFFPPGRVVYIPRRNGDTIIETLEMD